MKIDVSNLKFQLRPDSQFSNIQEIEPSPFVAAAIQILLVISAIIFFFMLVISGIQWISSRGNAQEIENAKKRITAASVGLLIVFSVFVFIRILNAFFGVNIGGVGIGGGGGPNPTQSICPAPSLTVSSLCLGSNLTTNWDWSLVPNAQTYRLQIDDNANFGSPHINMIVSGPTIDWTDPTGQTNYGRIRVEAYSGGSCTNPGDWSSPSTITLNCVAPSPSPAPNTCQCDWNTIQGQWVVTQNNCNATNVPICSSSSCECVPIQ